MVAGVVVGAQDGELLPAVCRCWGPWQAPLGMPALTTRGHRRTQALWNLCRLSLTGACAGACTVHLRCLLSLPLLPWPPHPSLLSYLRPTLPQVGVLRRSACSYNT